jgi:transposase
LLRAGKKGGLAVGKTKRGKGTKIMAITDAAGLPVAAHVESASPHEVKLVEATIESGFTRYAPDNLVGDKAYDNDRLHQQLLKERGVQMIAPHRRGRKKLPTQDGRKLRRYRRRWKVERLFAWLQNFRWWISPKKVDRVKHKVSASVFHIQPDKDIQVTSVFSADYRRPQYTQRSSASYPDDLHIVDDKPARFS